MGFLAARRAQRNLAAFETALALVEPLLLSESRVVVRTVDEEPCDIVVLARGADLRAEQVGYAVGPDGESLMGRRGRWRPSWVVVGRDDLCGDPFFVDTAAPGFPVFTAEHGGGMWVPEKVADSCAVFLAEE